MELGHQLEALCSTGRANAVLVAPFIKASALLRVLEGRRPARISAPSSSEYDLRQVDQVDAMLADLAPDLIAPWRHPTITIAYVDARLPAEDAGLVPAEGRADASLITRWTDDHGLLSPAEPWRNEVEGLPVADPCHFAVTREHSAV